MSEEAGRGSSRNEERNEVVMDWEDVQGRRMGVGFQGMRGRGTGSKLQCSLHANTDLCLGICHRIDTAV